MLNLQNNPYPEWIPDAIFYQIFPDRFCNGDPKNDPKDVSDWLDLPTRENFFGGDLQGVLDKLDYLEDLGVNALYLNPIFQARTNHRYDTSDYFQIDSMLGSQKLFTTLVEQVHQRGMHIILDGVFNHCGDGFGPFQDVMNNGANSSYADWFYARSYPLCKQPLNFLSCGGCTYLPKLNYTSRKVQEYILSVARYWLQETAIDGWRLDVPFKVPFTFWREFNQVVKSINPNAYLVGEVWREAGPWIQGDIFDGVTNYRLRDLVFDYVQTQILDGEDFGFELEMLLQSHGQACHGMLNLLDSHDTPRILTTFKGEMNRLKIALTIQMTLPGAPMVYYGDEIGLLGETDPDCRRCMPWNSASWNLNIFSMTRDLIRLRKEHIALRYGHPQKLIAFNGVYAYKQAYENDEVIVILNPRENIQDMKIPIFSTHDCWQDYFTNDVFSNQNGYLNVDRIPACNVIVLLPVTRM